MIYGHVLEATSILGVLVVRPSRSSKRPTACLMFAAIIAVDVVLIGGVRLALNKRHPSDLLAGVLGALSALPCCAWLTRSGGRSDRPPREPFHPSVSFAPPRNKGAAA